ncbi:MAG: hypothetical protein QM831_13215 [Kofleriaceae bacterium]
MSNLPRAVAKGEGTADVVPAWKYALLGPVVAVAMWIAIGVPDHLPTELRWLAKGHVETVVPADEHHLEFREVIESETFKNLPGAEVDTWYGETDNGRHTDYYVESTDRAALEKLVATVQLPPNTQVEYELVHPPADSKIGHDYWRTYIVSKTVSLDETAIADAEGAYDQYTNRPVVMLSFTREGGRAFGALTERIVGKKLATLWGKTVVMAPTINGPIRGGRAQISMGGNDPTKAEQERDRMVSALHRSAPTYVAVADPTRRLIASLVIGLVLGGGAFLLLFLTKPERRREPVLEGSGGRLGKRIAWTIFGVLVYLVGVHIVIPGINEVEMTHVIGRAGSHYDLTQISIFCIGLAPIISSYVLVELVASIVPPWRKARQTMRGRKRLDLAAAIGAALVAIVQGYFITLYFSNLDRMGTEIWDPHMRFGAWAAISTGPMLLAAVALMISLRGLGNGFVWLLLTSAAWSMPWGWLFELPKLELVILAAMVAMIAWLASRLAVWCIRSIGRATLPLPISGIGPLSDAGGIVTILKQISLLGLVVPVTLAEWSNVIQTSFFVGVFVLALMTTLFGVAFARPGRKRALLAPTDSYDLPQFVRGLVLTIFILGGMYLVEQVIGSQLAIPHFIGAPMIALATMFAIDLRREWRARTAIPNAMAVWSLHDPMLVEPARDRLADIPHFITMTNSRALFWLFAPYIPMQVHVPAERAMEAHERLRAWLDS